MELSNQPFWWQKMGLWLINHSLFSQNDTMVKLDGNPILDIYDFSYIAEWL